MLYFCLLFVGMCRTTFSVDPDTHIDSLEQAEDINIEGTSKWSCKIAITGTWNTKGYTFLYTFIYTLYTICEKFPYWKHFLEFFFLFVTWALTRTLLILFSLIFYFKNFLNATWTSFLDSIFAFWLEFL